VSGGCGCGTAGAEIRSLGISGLRLPRLDNVSVRAGDAEDLTDVVRRGAGGAGSGGTGGGTGGGAPPKRRPVPVIPRSC